MPIISALGKLRQNCCKLQASKDYIVKIQGSLDYKARSCLKNKQNNQNQGNPLFIHTLAFSLNKLIHNPVLLLVKEAGMDK